MRTGFDPGQIVTEEAERPDQGGWMSPSNQSDLIGQLAERIEEEDLFDRERKSNRTRALALLLYHAKNGCRETARLVSQLAEPVSHSPISTWYRRASQLFRERSAKRHAVLVADETTVHVETKDGDLEEWFLWVAVNPRTEKVVYATFTQGRSGIEALGFVRGVLRYCSNVPLFVVDRGVWYPWAFEQVGANYKVVSGGVRNRIETWIGLVKDRLIGARARFPHTASWASLRNWALGDAFVYNLGRGQPRLT